MNSTRPDTPPEPAPDLLGDRYRLGPAIGQGRSTVYRAVDVRLQRAVAVKEVRLTLDGPGDSVGTRHRALREAQAAARLSDPHVVAVYDVLEERGAIWLVMELVDSPSLSQLVNEEGPLHPVRAARIALDVLGALGSAHDVGVVHRDVKPANVMVVPGDRAKLTDFGVAKIRDDTQVTATGLVIGSPSYMAPEQARGERAGPAADLWALGATLYFAVEGVPPFSGGNAIAVATAVIYGMPRPPERAGPLAPLLKSLLVKEADERPSPGEVRRQLHAAVTHLRREAAPGPAPGSPFRSRRRGRKGRAGEGAPPAVEPGGGTAVFPPPVGRTDAAQGVAGPGAPVAPPAADEPIAARGPEPSPAPPPGPTDVAAADGSPGPSGTMASPAPASERGAAPAGEDERVVTEAPGAEPAPADGAEGPAGPPPTSASSSPVGVEAEPPAEPRRTGISEWLTAATSLLSSGGPDTRADAPAPVDGPAEPEAAADGPDGPGVAAAVDQVPAGPAQAPPGGEAETGAAPDGEGTPDGEVGADDGDAAPGGEAATPPGDGPGTGAADAAEHAADAGPAAGAPGPPAATPRTIVIDDLDDEAYEPAHMATPTPAPAGRGAAAAAATAAAAAAAGAGAGATESEASEPDATGWSGGSDPGSRSALDYQPVPPDADPAAPGRAAPARDEPAEAGDDAGAPPGGSRPTIVIGDLDEPGASPAGAAAGGPTRTGTPPSGEQAAAGDWSGPRHVAGRGASRGGASGPPSLIRPIGPPGRRRPTPLLIGAVLVVLLLLVLAVRTLAGGDDGDDNETGPGTTLNADTGEPTNGGGDPTDATDPTATDTTTDDATATDDTGGAGDTDGDGDGDGDGTTATTAETTTTAEPTTTTAPIGVVPPGWTEFAGPGGRYTIAHPADWRQVEARTNQVRFRNPANGTYLLVEFTDTPEADPVADWQNQSVAFAAGHENYETIRIDPVPYRDYNAAIWEFRYRQEGADLHAGNLGFVTGGRGYALYFQTHEEDWLAGQALFQQFQLAFRPGG